MPWPDVHCPPGSGLTARKHLDHIVDRAHRDQVAGLKDIEAAVEACLKEACLRGDPPQRGKAPPVSEHGAAVLWARVCADDGNWDDCEKALRHGVAPPTRKKKPKSDEGSS